ncbi:hypothetical protein AGMMS49545_02140 [Betaproteobacteria bacterium]|nr:hypothetical protein AGMMS49545_02140 [Betaproteobacteria bacterium]GHU43837.1 hypothetical protein AGMMS50289_10970 [Betaproteobacteria bacterium]
MAEAEFDGNTVLLTAGAVLDLRAIYERICKHDRVAKANSMLAHFVALTDNLTQFPLTGFVVPELRDLGVTQYRELFFKPYRMLYRVTGTEIVIYLITDSRREMQSLLERRLFEA